MGPDGRQRALPDPGQPDDRPDLCFTVRLGGLGDQVVQLGQLGGPVDELRGCRGKLAGHQPRPQRQGARMLLAAGRPGLAVGRLLTVARPLIVGRLLIVAWHGLGYGWHGLAAGRHGLGYGWQGLAAGRGRLLADVTGEDALMQKLQFGPGLDAKFGHETAADLPEHGERLGPLAGQVPGRHEHPGEALVQRVAGQRRGQLGGGLPFSPAGEHARQAVLQHRQALLGQPVPDRCDPLGVRRVSQRRAVPERQRGIEQRDGGGPLRRTCRPAQRPGPLADNHLARGTAAIPPGIAAVSLIDAVPALPGARRSRRGGALAR